MARKSVKSPDGEAIKAEVAVVRRDILNQARDSMGFVLGDQPSITSEQILWLSYRMEVESDEEATALASFDTAKIESWLDNNDFLAVYDAAVRNKREGFKLITTQLLPKALRTINMLLDKALEEGNMRGAQIGLNMLLRVQGLLIDKVSTDGADKIDTLMDMLRGVAPIQVINMEPR